MHLTAHARSRLLQRGITEDQLDYALNHQIIARRRPGQQGSVWLFGYTQGGRILKVCVSVADETTVITAAWPDE